MKLVTCEKCKGTGEVYCCNGHMCSGVTECGDCRGQGKQLSKKDKQLKKKLLELMEYE